MSRKTSDWDNANQWWELEEKAFERVKKAIKEKKADKLGEWLKDFGAGKGFIDFGKEFGGKKSKKDDWL